MAKLTRLGASLDLKHVAGHKTQVCNAHEVVDKHAKHMSKKSGGYFYHYPVKAVL